METVETTSYWLDKEDRIVKVGGRWDHFALENDGKEITSSRVVGNPIWKYISGDASVMWLRTLLDYSRMTNTILERTYRCDSPAKRRFMKMTVTPESKGTLRIDHFVERVEERKAPVYIYPGNPPKVLFRCSVCGKINKGEQWYEPDHLSIKEQHQDGVFVAYSVCEQCKSFNQECRL